MRVRINKPRLTMRGSRSRTSLFALAAAICFILPCSVQAADLGGLKDGEAPVQVQAEESGRFFDEVRLGVMGTDLEDGQGDNGDYVINGEVLLAPLGGHYQSAALEIFFRPRPHIGFSWNPDGGVSQAYAGLTWSVDLTERFFAEASFGGAVHDGATDDGNDSFGCELNFRESASLGFRITQQLIVMATVDHMSNAGLCGQNQGITNSGVRFGYRW
jgi:hypothetical protein